MADQLLAATFDLGDEPAITTGIALLAAGARPDEAQQRAVYQVRDAMWRDAEPVAVGSAMESDPRWRRAQAGLALTRALCPSWWPGPDSFEELWHARLAFGESWTRVKADLRTRLRPTR